MTTPRVEYVREAEWYCDFWAVVDTSIRPSSSEEGHPTIALCFSEAIATRVAELVAGDEQLRAEVREYSE